jgi:hypothetical protein
MIAVSVAERFNALLGLDVPAGQVFNAWPFRLDLVGHAGQLACSADKD